MTSEERAEAERLANDTYPGFCEDRGEYHCKLGFIKGYAAGRDSLLFYKDPQTEQYFEGKKRRWSDHYPEELIRLSHVRSVLKAERERSRKLKGKIDDAICSAIYEYYPGTNLAQQIAVLETVQEVWNEARRGE